MAPTLAPGDRIAVDTRGGVPRRGEIWVFASPIGGIHVKRVIGLPGETIEVVDGKVRVGGVALHEPYLTAPTGYELSPVRLGPDEFFMLGDSRNSSLDSHVWGPLGRRELIGRVDYRVWPGRRIQGLR
jgi:signal peptidase I